MIANFQNKFLKTITEAVLAEPKWHLYGQYCDFREQGLRKKAFTVLNEFLTSSKTWDFEAKKAFTRFLLEICDTTFYSSAGHFPEPLRRQLIKPTLIEWCESEKACSHPFRWYGKYFNDEAFINKAIEINPNDDKARALVISRLLAHINHATHHLPDYYIGDLALAFQWEKEVRVHLSFLMDEKYKTCWTRELKDEMILVNHYAAWKASGHPNFEQWGEENNKNVSSGLITVYYQP